MQVFMLGLLMSFLTLTASAQESTVYRSFEVKDASTGVLKVVVLDYGEPADQPYAMTISILCNDRRSKPNVVKPTEEVVIRNKWLCEFRRYEFDDKEKIVTLHYSTSEFKAGPAQCNGHFSQTFDLRQICAKWQP